MYGVDDLAKANISIDPNDHGCCSSDCYYLNENRCSLFNQELFGVNGFTRCAKCHSIKSGDAK